MALDIPRLDGRFAVVSDYQPAGDQPAAIDELERRVRRGDRHVGAARRHRHRQERDHGLAGRAAAAADAGARAQQDALRPAGQGVPRADAAQRGGVLRLLLRLLPARGVHPADRHLHREGLLDQRGGRAAAALGHDVAADPARRDRGGHRLGDLRPGHAGGVPRPLGQGRGRRRRSTATSCCAGWSRSSTRATTWRSTAARSGSAATRWRSSRRTRSWRSAIEFFGDEVEKLYYLHPLTGDVIREVDRAAHLPGHPLRGRPGADGAGDRRASRPSWRSGWPSWTGRASCWRRSGCGCAPRTTSR